MILEFKFEMTKKILLVGLCCIDTVNYVEKYPIEDSDVRVMEQKCCLGGNSTNSATVLRQFTKNVQLCSSLPTGNFLLEKLLNESKIDYSSSIIRNDLNLSIPHSTVICNTTNGTRTVLHYRGNLPEITFSEFKEKFSNGFGNYSWIHFEGRNFDQIQKMMNFVKTSKAENKFLMISVEFEKIRDFSWFENLINLADVIFMSKDFAQSKNWTNGEEAVLGLRNDFGATSTVIICPWGSKGVYGLDVQITKPIFVPAIEIKAIDTCGAGDCFIAASIWSMVSGKSLEESLQFASFVASKKCSQKGLNNILLE